MFNKIYKFILIKAFNIINRFNFINFSAKTPTYVNLVLSFTASAESLYKPDVSKSIHCYLK